MKRLGAVPIALLWLSPSVCAAAELTRIVSSFEPNHPFGFSLEVGYQRTQDKSKILRENYQGGGLAEVAEMNYLLVDQRMVIDARIGLWEDLEFKYVLPVVFAQDRSWRYAGGVSNANSTVTNNCLRANGELVDVNCVSTGEGRQRIFDPNSDSFRSGLGDMTFGLAYAIFNQEKDDTKPMWIVGLDYTAPTAAQLDPSVPTTDSARGNVGDKAHLFKLYTSFSRRMAAFDPYFQLHYTLPRRAGGFYSNCDHPSAENMSQPENCGDPAWTRADTGLQPPHRGGLLVGSEYNFFEDKSARSRIALDVQGAATYVSAGRYYNELSDLLGKLLYSEEYLQYGGGLAVIGQAAGMFTFQARASLLYSTPHRLTAEAIGKDIDGDGTVDITANPREVNPNFDYRADMVSRRFRATDFFTFRLELTARFNY